MALKPLKIGLFPAAVAVACVLAGAATVSAQGSAAGAAGQKKILRLGNPNTRLTPPMRNVAALKRTFASKRNQTAVSRVLDQAGLTSITPQVLKALTEGAVQETQFPVGGSIDWMALRRGGRPDIVRNAVWAGRAPFDAYSFSVEEGVKIYNFVVPKVCGNLTLANVTEKPLPECVTVAVARDCDTKQMTITASGAPISGNQITKVEVMRDGAKVVELLPGSGFKATMPLAAGRYSFRAFDTYGREVNACQREVSVEACPAPPPPPPPAPASCSLTATAAKAKGGWNIAVDGSQSQQGGSPATSMTVQLMGPAGTPVAFESQGKSQTEMILPAPFQATMFVRKAAPGTYTVRANSTAADPKAEARTCEATVTVVEEDRLSYFVEGDVGKERRVRLDEERTTVPTLPVYAGFCAPLVGLQGGVDYRLTDNWHLAPAIGFAINTDEGGQSSLFGDLAFNYHFDNNVYLGSGVGVWDFNHGDTVTGSWLVNFGIPVWENAKGNRLYFSGQWRFLFDGMDDIDNNYQVWGGLRYVWR